MESLNLPDYLNTELQELEKNEPNQFKKIMNHLEIFYKQLNVNKIDKLRADLSVIKEEDLVKKDSFKRVKRFLLSRKISEIETNGENQNDYESTSPQPKKKPGRGRKSIKTPKSTTISSDFIDNSQQKMTVKRKLSVSSVTSPKNKICNTEVTMDTNSIDETSNKDDVVQFVIYSDTFLKKTSIENIIIHTANASTLAVTKHHMLDTAQQYVQSIMLKQTMAMSFNDLINLQKELQRIKLPHVAYIDPESKKLSIIVTSPQTRINLNTVFQKFKIIPAVFT